MKGFVLCVAVILGIFVSNIVIGQESTTQSPVVIDGSITPDSAGACTSGSCSVQPTLIGMSRHAVKHTVERGRCVAQHTVGHLRHTTKTIWSKRPHLRRCKCC